MLPMTRIWLTREGEAAESSYLNTLISRGVHTNLAGLNAGEFKNYMGFIKDGGFLTVGTSSELEANTAAGIGGGFNNIRRAGHFFFNEAELGNGKVWC